VHQTHPGITPGILFWLTAALKTIKYPILMHNHGYQKIEPALTSTPSIHWMPIMTELWMNLN
jgi:hypothetical protein